MSATKPSTSSFAVLGLLALRPWTAYELAQQMQRSLRYAWPRSERHAYDEPKRLARLGWARAEEIRSGKRTRTRYSITPAGRRALRRWLAAEPARPAVEMEALLRVIHADHGGTDHLVAALLATRRQAAELRRDALPQVRDYLDRGGPFPERLHLIALFADFYARFLAVVEEWVDDSLAEVARWPGTADVGMTAYARAVFEEIVARFGDGEAAAQRD